MASGLLWMQIVLRLVYSQPNYSGRQRFRATIEEQPLERLLSLLPMVDRLDADTFDAVVYELVDRYRTKEDEQEAIAVAVTRSNLQMDDPHSRERLDEMLAMLMATHDPMI